MDIDNKEQGSTQKIETKNGAASDDKSKSGESLASQGPAGGNDASVCEPDTVTTNQITAERGGSAIDDRSKDFEVFDHPKA